MDAVRRMVFAAVIMSSLGLHSSLSVSSGEDLHSQFLDGYEIRGNSGSDDPLMTHSPILQPCLQPSVSLPQPLSVHSLRPQDVSSVTALGIPHFQRGDTSRVMSRLYDLLSMFSPNLTSLVQESSSDYYSHRRSLSEQAEELLQSLRSKQLLDSGRDWKLVLLLVPVEELCVCPDQASVFVKTIVDQVDESLHILLEQLRDALVSVVVWGGQSGPVQLRVCNCVKTYNEKEMRMRKALVTQAVQESLDRLLLERQWYDMNDDFTVMLQSTPIDADLTSFLEKGVSSCGLSPLQADKLALKLWTNLLQPTNEEPVVDDNTVIKIRCPSEDHPFLRTMRNSLQEPSVQAHSTGGHKANSPLPDTVMGSELLCEDLSPSDSIPTSVHTLRPADIKVVAAIGDSLTAGNGIGSAPGNLLDVLRQYRGLSWSIGGDDNLTSVTTLPNILRKFNPSLTGFSVGTGKQNDPNAFLNQAVAGATSEDIVAQVRTLVAKMKNDSRIDFQADWKVITVFVGGNDLCDQCIHSVYFSADNFVSRIQEALDILHKEVPRALVNLVEVLHIVPLRRLHQMPGLNCPSWLVNILCRCVISPNDGSIEHKRLDGLNRAYQRGLQQLVESGRYDTHPSFTVVLQPFFREVTLPLLEDGRPDRSFFSPDCFHLSQKAHTIMARALWNNMLEALGNKTNTQDFSQGPSLSCPTKASPFLRTYQNSNYTYQGTPPVPPPITNWGSDLSCVDHAPSDPAPSLVHKLRPADIKVVAALGDSVTAGSGAKSNNILQLQTEYRGISWSIGADNSLDRVTTLPNILKEFNPSLRGFSLGQGSKQRGFNMAVPGAVASEIPSQVESLIQALKESKDVDFEKDWKLVTLFIGISDLCHYCLDQGQFSPMNYSHHLMQSLDLLYQNVPRVMVNVVEVMQVEILRRVKRDTLTCSLNQRKVCPCILIPDEDSMELSEMKRINREYQTETESLISAGRYDNREDFAAVVQPFFQNTMNTLSPDGKPDLSYFCLDCVQFSERAHAAMAISLWNNMLEPVGRKHVYNNFTYDRNKIKCPSEAQPYIFTRVNSLPSPPSVPPTTSTATVTASQASTSPVELVCPSHLPMCTSPVLAVIGLLIGWGITWTVVLCRQRQHRRRENMKEMKGTEL